MHHQQHHQRHQQHTPMSDVLPEDQSTPTSKRRRSDTSGGRSPGTTAASAPTVTAVSPGSGGARGYVPKSFPFAMQPLSPVSSAAPASPARDAPTSHQQQQQQPPASPMRTCLLIVDVQNDFCTGSLKAPDALSIIPVINRLRVQYDWDLVCFSTDAHPTDHVSFHINHASRDPTAQLYQPYVLPSGQVQVLWPVHCVQGTWGASIHNDVIRDPERDVVVEKGTARDQEFYSAFVSTDGRHRTGLSDLLRSNQITHVATCGLVYEYCVGNSALDSAGEGFQTYLVTDATRSLTRDGMESMSAKLEAAGVDAVSSGELAACGFPTKAQASKGRATTTHAMPPRSGIHLAVPSPPSPSPPPPATSTLLGSRYNFAHAQHPQLQQHYAHATTAASVSPHRSPMAHSRSEYNLPTPTTSRPADLARSRSPSASHHTAAGASASGASSSSSSSSPHHTMAAASHGVPPLSPSFPRASSPMPPAALACLSPSTIPAASFHNNSNGSSSTSSHGPIRPRLLLGLSGSVATIKVADLLRLLCRFCDVRLVCTGPSTHFFSASELTHEFGVQVFRDEDEWRRGPWKRGDPVLHVELRKWADLMVVAPLSANTLAKLAHGLCDNLLTTTVRCWSFATHPLLVAPAMNTVMWDSPFTRRQLDTLQSLGPSVTVIQPVAKKLACGDVGKGAMASVQEIEQAVREAWRNQLQAGYVQAEESASSILPPLSPQPQHHHHQPPSPSPPQLVPRLSHQQPTSTSATPNHSSNNRLPGSPSRATSQK